MFGVLAPSFKIFLRQYFLARLLHSYRLRQFMERSKIGSERPTYKWMRRRYEPGFRIGG